MDAELLHSILRLFLSTGKKEQDQENREEGAVISGSSLSGPVSSPFSLFSLQQERGCKGAETMKSEREGGTKKSHSRRQNVIDTFLSQNQILSVVKLYH